MVMLDEIFNCVSCGREKTNLQIWQLPKVKILEQKRHTLLVRSTHSSAVCIHSHRGLHPYLHESLLPFQICYGSGKFVIEGDWGWTALEVAQDTGNGKCLRLRTELQVWTSMYMFFFFFFLNSFCLRAPSDTAHSILLGVKLLCLHR